MHRKILQMMIKLWINWKKENSIVFIDDFDISLHVKACFENALLTFSCKHPILLKRDGHLTDLIIF